MAPAMANGRNNFLVIVIACSIISSVIFGFFSISTLERSIILSTISGNKTYNAKTVYKTVITIITAVVLKPCAKMLPKVTLLSF